MISHGTAAVVVLLCISRCLGFLWVLPTKYRDAGIYIFVCFKTMWRKQNLASALGIPKENNPLKNACLPPIFFLDSNQPLLRPAFSA